MNATKCVGALLFVCLGSAFAQDAKHDDELAVIELGAAPSRNLTDRVSSVGPTFAVEISPIPNWLELEVGVTPSFGRKTIEWSTDLLFKKPWTLSEKIEFM